MEDIIKQLEYMRIKHGITKRSLAAQVDITEQYYSKIVTGNAPGCAYTIIAALLKAVGIQLTAVVKPEILEGFEKKK